jgi:outer membrane protein assembly factor BamB
MKRIILGIICTAIILSAAFGNGFSVTPSIWQENTQREFEKGSPEQVCITSEGEITLAPELEEVADVDALYVWALAQDRKGNLYAGTGNEGRIFKIGPKGKSALLFDSPEVGIHSLALDGKGNLYAGSSPDGIVYRITPQGQASVFCHTGQRYIWALTFGPDGVLYAATGDQGHILKISQEGTSQEWFSSTDDHMMCLLADEEGVLYAGSAGSGLIYRITPQGAGRVLYDAPEKEIHALAFGADGTLYAGAMSGSAPSLNPSGEKVGAPPRKIAPVPFSEQGCALYQINGEAVREIWRSEQPLLLSLLVRPSESGERILVGTGKKGMIYAVDPDGAWSTLTKLSEAQPLSMLSGKEGVFIGAGDIGRVHRLTPSYSAEGTFTSQVHDAAIISRWGAISVRAEIPKGTAITLATRSGNTEKPDDTWSDWEKTSEEKVQSPPARFLQYRAMLTTSEQTAAPILQEVCLAGLQTNLKPQITSVTVSAFGAPPIEFGNPGEEKMDSPPLREAPKVRLPKIMKRSFQRIRWRAQDPNEDRLIYTLVFRGVEEKAWKLLKEKVKTSSYLWDTEACPDGQYLLKVTASDRLSNPDSDALSAQRTSKPFIVDNTSPYIADLTVSEIKGGKLRIRGIAGDATSPLKSAEYAIDSGDWVVIFPEDGIFDSKREPFLTTTSELERGEHTLVVRVTDVSDNVGSGKQVVEVGEK